MENEDVDALARDYYLKGFGFAESILDAVNDLGVIKVSEPLLKASTGFRT